MAVEREAAWWEAAPGRHCWWFGARACVYPSTVHLENGPVWNVLNPEVVGKRFPNMLVLNSRLGVVEKRGVVIGSLEWCWAGDARRYHRMASVLALFGK